MKYRDFEKVFVKKEMTLPEWNKAHKIKESAVQAKVAKELDEKLNRMGLLPVTGNPASASNKKIMIDDESKMPDINYNLTVRRQVQNRHIEGTKEYQQYVENLSEKKLKPSKLLPSINVAELVNKFHKKGKFFPNPKDGSPREIVDIGKIAGQYWDKEKQEFVDTSKIMIVYSNKGVHIYPIFYEE